MMSRMSVLGLSLALLAVGTIGGKGAEKRTAADAGSIRVSDDGRGFVFENSGEPFIPWGVNFVGDHGRVLEEYWDDEWPLVEKQFQTLRELEGNVVRLHLQVGTYMTSPTEADPRQLERLRKALDLALENGLYVDLTGLNCFHLSEIPDWYDGLSESERWEVQAHFWEAIAKTCADHPAVFCYDLMNEPVVTEAKEGEHPWLGGELGGMYFVQRISHGSDERDRNEIVTAWVQKMTQAIRKHDSEHLITVGIIAWAAIWPNAKPLFYGEEPAKSLDFVSLHIYPKSGEVEKSVNAIATYEIGKPIVIEETFPLSCSIEELDQFIDGTDGQVAGWVGHYFGKSIADHEAGTTLQDAIIAKALAHWRDKGREFRQRQLKKLNSK